MLPALGTSLFIGTVAGIGSVVTYIVYKAAHIGREEENMPQEKLKPPQFLEKLQSNQTVDGLLPMNPAEGPPLPRILNLKWPWVKK